MQLLQPNEQPSFLQRKAHFNFSHSAKVKKGPIYASTCPTKCLLCALYVHQWPTSIWIEETEISIVSPAVCAGFASEHLAQGGAAVAPPAYVCALLVHGEPLYIQDREDRWQQGPGLPSSLSGPVSSPDVSRSTTYSDLTSSIIAFRYENVEPDRGPRSHGCKYNLKRSWGRPASEA